MSQGPSEPGPTVSAGPGDDDQDRPHIPAREQVTRPMERPVLPAHQPTEVAPVVPADRGSASYQPTEVAPSYQPTEVAPSYQPTVPATVAAAARADNGRAAPPGRPAALEPDRHRAADSAERRPAGAGDGHARRSLRPAGAADRSRPAPPRWPRPRSSGSAVPGARQVRSRGAAQPGRGVGGAGVAHRADARPAATAPGPVPPDSQPRADHHPARGGRGAAVPAVPPLAVPRDRRADPVDGPERVHGERDRADPHQRLVRDDLLPVGVHPAVRGRRSRSASPWCPGSTTSS